MHVHVDELGAERAAERRGQVARLHAERHRRAGVVDLEVGQVVRAGVEVRTRSGRRSCPARCRRPSGRSLSKISVPLTTSLTTVRTACAVPPSGAVLVTTRTLLPSAAGIVTRERCRSRRPSADACVVRCCVGRHVGDVDLRAGNRGAGDDDRVGGAPSCRPAR